MNKMIIGANVQIVSMKCSFIKNRLVILLKIRNKNIYKINVVIKININME